MSTDATSSNGNSAGNSAAASLFQRAHQKIVLLQRIDEQLVVPVTPALYRLRATDGTYLPIEINASTLGTHGQVLVIGRYSGDRHLQDRIMELLTGGAAIPDIVANPERAHFFNTDCASCHTESTRRAALDFTPPDDMFRFVRPAGVSGVEATLVPRDPWNVRNFGWFQRRDGFPIQPTATVRLANEAAESVGLINHKYLKLTGTTP